MKKITKILLVLTLFMLVTSIFVSGAGAEDTVITFTQLYIGDYESENFTGEAHIIFATVSNMETEYGVIITDEYGNRFKFQGKTINEDGRFGIAIYELPDGNYFANSYTGEGDARILGETVPFTKGVSTYNITYNLAGGTAAYDIIETVHQGSILDLPENPTKEGWAFIGWTRDTWANTLVDNNTIVYSDITLNAIYAPVATESYRLTLDNNVSGQYTTLTSAINPTLVAGEQVVLTFDINKVYSNVSRVIFATQDIAHARAANWPAYNGVNADYAHASYYYAHASVWDNYSGMGAGSGKVAYDSNGLVNGVKHWVADDGWFLTGGSGIPNDMARYGSIPFGEGKSVKLVYTAPTATQKASLCLYTKAVADGDAAYVLNSAIMDIPAYRSDLMRTVQIMLDTNACLDMNVSNLSCITSGGQNLGVQIITTTDGNIGTIAPEEFVVVNPNVLTYSIEVTNNASTTGFGGADVLAVPYGGSLVYEFDVVKSNLGVQDVLETGDTSSSATNATMGWFGIGLRHSGAVSNWPWKMMYTNGSYAGITTNNIGGTIEYPMYGDSSNSHWWRLMETGANVKVVYTRATAGNSDGSFIIYKNGEVFAQNTGLGDITGNAAINFMWWDAGPRVLKVTNIYSYVVNANGQKGASTSPLGVDSLTEFVEVID